MNYIKLNTSNYNEVDFESLFPIINEQKYISFQKRLYVKIPSTSAKVLN